MESDSCDTCDSLMGLHHALLLVTKGVVVLAMHFYWPVFIGDRITQGALKRAPDSGRFSKNNQSQNIVNFLHQD